jgi:uncharacterized membrane protein YfcA
LRDGGRGDLGDYHIEIAGMLMGGIVAAWVGASVLSRIPKTRIMGVIALLLIGSAALLAAETVISGAAGTLLLSQDSMWLGPVAFVAGLLVGTIISSLLGVAGGEFIIPILIFVFGADIRTTASMLIGLPVVLTGVARHWLTGHCRSQTALAFLCCRCASDR